METKSNNEINLTQREFSLIDFLFLLWRGKSIIIACIIFSIFAGALYLIFATPVFTTSTIFITKNGRSNNNSLAQLALLNGINLGGSVNYDPSDYFDKIIQDKEFLLSLFKQRWFFKGDSFSLEQILKIEPDTTISNWDYFYSINKIETVRKKRLLSIRKDIKTGIITLTVSAPDPQLAYDLNIYTLNYLSDYVRNELKTQAKEKRLFIEERIKETKEDLFKSENALVKFKERNFASQSPQVTLEEARLLRRVNLNQEIYIQFQKQYELAKIEELDDQTLLQIIRNPEIPIKRSKPRKSILLPIYMCFGIFMGCIIVISGHFLFFFGSQLKKKKAI